MVIRKKFVNKINIIPIIRQKSDCKIQIIHAQEQIINLNKSLQNKCNNLNLKLDYLYNFDDNYKKITTYSNIYKYLLLALCNNENNECISTIEIILNTDKNIISFNSKTDANHENKKYNKLLLSVLIIISKLLMTDIEIVEAEAINPISAWLLLKYFNAIINPDYEENKYFIDYLSNNSIKHSDITLNILNIFKNETDDFTLKLHVLINDDNIENANTQFNQILTEITC